MTAYAIFQETVFNESKFESYKQLSSATVEQYGGVFLVRGGTYKVLEGETPHTRFVVIQFPSWDHAINWYDSTEYAEAKELRLAISTGTMVLVKGS